MDALVTDVPFGNRNRMVWAARFYLFFRKPFFETISLIFLFLVVFGGFFPQQLEKLGVLPRKLWGGLGQLPETWNQVHQGST